MGATGAGRESRAAEGGRVSEWDDRLNGHGAIQLVRQISTALGPLDASGGSVADMEGLARAKQATEVVRDLVDAADGNLVAASILDRMLPHAQNAMARAEAYATSHESDQLIQLNVHLDGVLDAASALIIAGSVVSPDQQREAAGAYRRAAGQLLSRVKEESEEASEWLRANVQDLTAKVDAASAAVDATRAEGEAKLAELKAATEAESTRFSTATTEAVSQQKASFEGLATELRASVETLREELNEKAAEGLAELDRLREEAARLVNLVGDHALAGGHGAYANEERQAADVWRYVAVASLSVVAALGFFYLETVGSAAFSWQSFWIRVVLIVPFGLLAAYAASQSGKHRDNEAAARRLALDLVAIGPYIERLTEDKRDAVRDRLADRFFAQSPAEAKADAVPGLQQAIEVISKALDKVK